MTAGIALLGQACACAALQPAAMQPGITSQHEGALTLVPSRMSEVLAQACAIIGAKSPAMKTTRAAIARIFMAASYRYGSNFVQR